MNKRPYFVIDELAKIQFTTSVREKKKEGISLKARGQELNIFCIGSPLFPPHYL